MRNLRLVLIFLTLLLAVPTTVQYYSMSESLSTPQDTALIGSLAPHDEIWIYGNEMFIEQAELEGWPGNGSPETPFIISGYYFNTWDKPLTIYHTTVHWIFTNNVINGEDEHGGTWIQNCTNGAIINNEIYNRRFGIAIAGGYGLNVTSNYVHDCWENGIEFIAGMNNTLVQNNVVSNIGIAGFYSGLSHDSIIVNNTFTNCGKYGISLLGVTSNCTITDNILSNCGTETIGGVGMRIKIFESSEVSTNRITNCTLNGLLIDSGNNSSIIWNKITNSCRYAVILLSDTNQISVKFNSFIDNGIDCQLLDDGTLNEITHNYYSDWTTPDDNADGYVDVPYSIEGTSDNCDEFPLVTAGVVPTETATSTFSVNILVLAFIVGFLVVGGLFYNLRNK